MYGDKIRMIRELRGYSQEYMAENLGIKQNMYSRIEGNQTKLTAEMLQKLAGVLGVSPMDIMSQQPAIVNFQPNQGTQNAIGHIETFVSEQRELIDKILASKDEEIERLNKIIEGLLKDKEQLMQLLKK